jgi:hypothetical protein
MKVWTSLPGLLDDAGVRPVAGRAEPCAHTAGAPLETALARAMSAKEILPWITSLVA